MGAVMLWMALLGADGATPPTASAPSASGDPPAAAQVLRESSRANARLALPPVNLPPLPVVTDPFEGDVEFRARPPGDPEGLDTTARWSAPVPPRPLPPETEETLRAAELRDPFAPTQALGFLATRRLVARERKILLDLLDPFVEVAPGAGGDGPRTVARDLLDLRDPFAPSVLSRNLDRRWESELRDPFAGNAEGDANTACPRNSASTPEGSAECTEAWTVDLRDPFNSQ